jgi:hypothetical protein
MKTAGCTILVFREKCTHEKISDAQLKSNLIEVAFIIKP